MPHSTQPHDDEYDDDKPIGRVLSRREALTLLSGAGAALFAAAGVSRLNIAQAQTLTPTLPIPTTTPLPSCVVIPELTDGPFFVDGQLNRSDIRIDPTDDSVKEGARLRLVYRVSQITANACTPLAGAQVDLWHCDALGEYSGVSGSRVEATDPLWLRGYQLTDAYGQAEFITVYPGWYPGRAVHMHFKIRTDPEAAAGYEFNSQLFFDEALTDIVHAEAPYTRMGRRNRMNAQDGIFQSSDGLLTLLVVEEEAGYAAIFDIGLDLSATL